jgi:hypothetical protein
MALFVPHLFIMRPPPLTSKQHSGPTDYEIKYVAPYIFLRSSRLKSSFFPRAQRLLEQREKARVRMAMCVPQTSLFFGTSPHCVPRKRAELRCRSADEQAAATARAREHQAAYRERYILSSQVSRLP